jgi:hypothetical protein
MHRAELEGLPRREELESLGRHYMHLHNEHERAQAGSAIRRRLEHEVQQVRERFDRLLNEWIPEEELRKQWREWLHHHASEPDGPPAIRPLVFKGRADASGSVVEVRGPLDDADVWIDGALVERVVAARDLTPVVPPLTFRVDGFEFAETFDASAPALEALAEFCDDRPGEERTPPWEHATELLSDGEILVHFDVTPRGRRALASR